MQSSLIGKIEKAKYYATEPQRATVNQLSVSFRGDNDTHTVTLHDNHWHCSCDFFADHETCCHTMALERILDPMLPVGLQTPALVTA